MRIWQGLVCLAMLLALPTWAADSKWEPTHYWESSTGGTVQTPLLWLNGDKWRLKHRHRGLGDPFRVELFDAAGNHVDTLVKLDEPLFGLSSRSKHQGQYYLRITSPGAWSVRLEQHLSLIELWQLRQMQRQHNMPLHKVAAWAGETMQAEYELEIGGQHWQSVCRNTGSGVLAVTIKEAESGAVVLRMDLQDQVEFASWGHRPGKYTLNLVATDTSWAIEIYAEAAHAETIAGE